MELLPPMFKESGDMSPRSECKSACSKNTTFSGMLRGPKISDLDMVAGSQSFRALETGVPKDVSPEKKLAWLRSQTIGSDAEFDTPYGRRRLTYADHTASGRCLHYIEDFIINDVLPFYGNTHTSDSYVGHRTTKMAHEAAKYIKRCLGGGEDDAILFCGSGSTAAIKRLQEVMGIAIPSILREQVLSSLKEEKRWLVFVGPYEHHSNLLSWRQSLAEVVEIGLDEDGLIDMKALRNHLEAYKHANRPVLGSFSACSNVTGLYTDTRAIARLLHQYGGFACFDFAASGPYVEIDMRSGEMDGYDAIFLSPHKFIGGPGTPGVLLMNKGLYRLGSNPPSTCGGGTVDYVNGFSEEYTIYAKEVEERENGGTPQIIQIIRAALTFWVKEYIGYQVIEKQEHTYIQEALDRLLPNPNVLILGNTTADRQAILSFVVYTTTNSSSASPVHHHSSHRGQRGLFMWGETGNKRDKPLHGPFVAALLNDLFGIQARGGCACAGPYGHTLLGVDEPQSLAFREAILKGYSGVKPGWTRVSFPYYMSTEEFEYVLAALEFVSMFGQRFLPLYSLNLKTGSWTFRKRAMRDITGTRDSTAYKNMNVLPLSSVFQAMCLDMYRSDGGCKEDDNKICSICNYATYLESARHLAALLPKFPPARRLREDIDPQILYFRV